MSFSIDTFGFQPDIIITSIITNVVLKSPLKATLEKTELIAKKGIDIEFIAKLRPCPGH